MKPHNLATQLAAAVMLSAFGDTSRRPTLRANFRTDPEHEAALASFNRKLAEAQARNPKRKRKS